MQQLPPCSWAIPKPATQLAPVPSSRSQHGVGALPCLLPQLDPLPRAAMGTPSLLRVNLERPQSKMMLTSGLTPEPKIKGPRGWVGLSADVCHLCPHVGKQPALGSCYKIGGTQQPAEQCGSGDS